MATSQSSTVVSNGEPVEYRDIAGFPGYRVGSDGSVWGCRMSGKAVGRFREWRRMTPSRIGKGYHGVHLMPGYVPRAVHRLVLEAFVGPRPPGSVCCHNNGCPTDNRLENLRWGTPSENMQDASRHGTIHRSRGELSASAKLTSEMVLAIRKQCAEGADRKLVAVSFGVSKTTIQGIVTRKTWKHVP